MALHALPPREREVAENVLRSGEASAAEIRAALSGPISDAAVRTMLRRLEAKGVVRRRRSGRRFLYAPAWSATAAREAAAKRLGEEHFGGSLGAAAVLLIDLMEAQQPGAARALQPALRRIYRRRRSGGPAAPR